MPRPKPSCGDKTRYSTEAVANAHLDRIASRPHDVGQKVPVRAYYCQRCKGWHVTCSPGRNVLKEAPR